MRLLLDTHIFLWAVQDDKKLTSSARNLMKSASEVYVSSASIWEAGIKIKLKKLNANINDLVASIEKSGFIELSITAQHAAQVYQFPHLHRDPFDRLLIAQAINEPLKFVTADEMLKQYSDVVEVV